jgi:hypothetical protein
MHRPNRGLDHDRRVNDIIARTYPWEAFIPGGRPYLGQAVFGEPVRWTNVLFPNRRHQ